jgi:hypothetical protein
MVGKWLGALKEIAPATDRVAIVVNPGTAPLRGTFYLREFETAAATLGVKPICGVFCIREPGEPGTIAAANSLMFLTRPTPGPQRPRGAPEP